MKIKINVTIKEKEISTKEFNQSWSNKDDQLDIHDEVDSKFFKLESSEKSKTDIHKNINGHDTES